MTRVYKTGQRLPAGNGITSLLANPQWSHTFLQDIPTVTQTMQVCARRTPFFVCATLEAAIAAGIQPAGRLPDGAVVEVWEAETPEAFAPPMPWIPHPDLAYRWFGFWQRTIDYDGSFLAPDLSGERYPRVPVPPGTLLCFELTVLAPLYSVPASRGA
jgi:hypothetical protein